MNRFSLLDSDNEDETPVSKAPKKEKDEKKPAAKAPAPAPAPAAAKKDAPPAVAKKDEGKPAKDTNAPKPKDGEKKPKKEAPPAASSPVPAVEFEGRKDDSRGGRGRGRGDRRERGGRGGGRGRGDSNPDGSDVKNDRQSHFQSDKRGPRGPRKDGGGRFNTGSASADAREAEKDPSALTGDADVTPDEGVDGEGPATEDAPAVEETPAEPVVPEETYEQYMAKRNEARANADLFGARNDTRVVDNTIIPGKVKTEVKPEDVNSFIIGQEKVKAAKKSEQRSTTSKAQVVEVAFQVEASAPPADDYADRGGRGRGRGRGEGRGGGGRGGSGRSSPRSSGPRVDISSDELFPSL